MEPVYTWTIQGDLEEVHAIVACAAEKVGMPKPDPSIREVIVPGRLYDRFVSALYECDKNWADKGLAGPT